MPATGLHGTAINARSSLSLRSVGEFSDGPLAMLLALDPLHSRKTF